MVRRKIDQLPECAKSWKSPADRQQELQHKIEQFWQPSKYYQMRANKALKFTDGSVQMKLKE